MSLLTLEDLAWLRQYRESLSGWSRYQLANARAQFIAQPHGFRQATARY